LKCELSWSVAWLGGMTPGGAVVPAAAATPRSVAADTGRPATGMTPARTPGRDRLSINPDEDMYVDGDVGEHQQVSTQI